MSEVWSHAVVAAAGFAAGMWFAAAAVVKLLGGDAGEKVQRIKSGRASRLGLRSGRRQPQRRRAF